jgi:hypothetical protein
MRRSQRLRRGDSGVGRFGSFLPEKWLSRTDFGNFWKMFADFTMFFRKMAES